MITIVTSRTNVEGVLIKQEQRQEKNCANRLRNRLILLANRLRNFTKRPNN
jgi:hypothetical protein